ncbi:TPA: nickel/cobalt efflux protein RcnA [Pseudomonas aeruginosa]|nr:nickel/cobalt efflux protein RcnA [Pseudomonas aeruginosa]MBG4469324.1 nickel/cobalt efflux protein RcnA [Pseudomonas aeruginosa]MBG6812921.1 nickel/cobalt efflux protein RcnA [Pseudomonas aeruginosa]MBH3805336.1 nickel/cobalt efflux protein RcnA [Pseudomonas aeruginosa]
MTDFSTLLQQGTSSAWLFVPSAILLGALHGLEPGHSKTMMAAFIVAIRGTVGQAVLLGLSATVSHTAVVWAVALAGMYFGQNLNPETTEPYFQLASAALVVCVAAWMIWRTWRDQKLANAHDHHHDHADETKRIDTGHGILRIEIFEDGVPPRFRLFQESRQQERITPDQIALATHRSDGSRQAFSFVDQDGYFESLQEIPEPHEFKARLEITHGHHSHDYELEYKEHDHGHDHAETAGLDVSSLDYQDAHERAHANDIKRRFANKDVTTGQIVMFGLTGGLVPCPASITVLLLCLQLKRFVLGAGLVLCFSIGLAITMVVSGTVAALSVKQVSKKWNGFGDFARKAPYFSSALILLVGFYMAYQGASALHWV